MGYDIPVSGSHINTAYVSFASAPGAVTFPERSDTAVFSTSPATPTKIIVGTNQTHTADTTVDNSGNPRPVSIGEIIRYRLAIQIPEGTAAAARVVDDLPAGLQYMPGTAAVALVSTGGIASSFTCTTGAGLNMTGSASTVTPTCGIDANGSTFNNGTDPVFDMGDLVNNDSDADDEFIVIEFDAIVLNSDINNQQGDRASNRFYARFNGNNSSYSNRVYVSVVEPQITVTPSTSLPTTETVSISLEVSNTGLATAFQVMGEANTPWTFTLPNGLQEINNLTLNVTGDVFENNTVIPLALADFTITGASNELLTLTKTLQLDPGAEFTLSFDANVIPGVYPTSSASSSVFEYASQSLGDELLEVRTGADISSGTGNEPITDKTVINDYRAETLIEILSISGSVYIDMNSDQNLTPGENGISGVTMVLRDLSDNSCRSVKTNTSGEYGFYPVASGNYEVIESAQEATPVPSQCPPQSLDPMGYTSTTTNTITAVVTTSSLLNQDFGDLSGPTYTPDHSGQVLPGNVVFYAHQFTTPADGTVVFTSAPEGAFTAGWSNEIYQDSNCDGILNGAEAGATISGNSYPLDGGEKICLINKVFAPSNAVAQDQYTVVSNAEFTYDGGGLGVENLQVTDVTTSATSAESTSRLQLRKTVKNLTQTASLETATLNQAAPGDILLYTVYYRNSGTAPITDLNITDSVPAFTNFEAGSESCDVTPTGLFCTANRNADDIWWGFTGSLAGGAGEGSVSFRVKVDF